MTKYPSKSSVLLSNLTTQYHAFWFKEALSRYILIFRHIKKPLTKAQLEIQLPYITLPFRSIPVYHKARFWLGDRKHLQVLADEWDIVYATPSYYNKYQHIIPGRFDTVLVNMGQGKYVGLKGKSSYHLYEICTNLIYS